MWELKGTAAQVEIASAALARCDFPWDLLAPGLRAAVGRDAIPVEWADLSRWAGDDADPLEARGRVLGLAWYSGKVSLDVTLERDPELAAEVLLAEGAHMVDFFYLTSEVRGQLWGVFHPGADGPIGDTGEVGHGHGWFDAGGYESWVGESFMGAFVEAFSDVPVTIGFDHRLPPGAAAVVRRILLPATPAPFFGLARSTVFHDTHDGIGRDVEWGTWSEAAAGRRPCRVCRPTDA